MIVREPTVGPRLRVPVRIRITPRAAGKYPLDDVHAAIADAVARACSRIPFADLGLSHNAVTCVQPTVQLVSDARDVPQALLDTAVHAAAQGAARAGLQSPKTTSVASTRSVGTPWEPFDPTRVRYRPTGLTYVLPFYDGGETEVPLREEPGHGPRPWMPGPGEVVSVAQAIDIAWRWHVYRNGRWALDRELPGFYGFIRTTAGVWATFLFLYHIKGLGPDGAPLRFNYELSIDDLGVGFSIISFPNSQEWFTLSRSGMGGTGSWITGPDSAGDAIPIVFANQPMPPRTGKPGGAGGPIPGPGMPPDAKQPGGTGADTTSALAPLDAPAQPRSAEGEQNSWPGSPTGDFEVGVCKPFYTEPLVEDVVDRHNLAARMRALAAALGIPECGYLGNFALQCMRSISAHAVGVAAASVASAVLANVTVHPNGNGNNGYVDVQPGDCAELQWLRRLAGLAREVGEFGRDVTSAYLDPSNAGKTGVWEGERKAPSWVYHFLLEMNPGMVQAYRTVFTETCRALLLQQLRSSAVGISGRREPTNFGNLVQDFRTKLEILGDVVLWPTVLLQAVEYAGSVFVTSGTVREILSREFVMGDITIPAPIDSVPRKTLDLVGDARVEKRGDERVALYNGRAWTADELRQTINQRRAILNMTDPLFLQIPDLQRIVRGAETDPGYLERYLGDLLSDMAGANAKMTREASDIEDGGQFALEVSMYIEREGGTDWRGLRYTLQGIHKLADDQLAPVIRGDSRYVAGINAAIDRKAFEDTLMNLAQGFGIIALSLLCAPLGAVAAAAITGIANIAFTVHQVLDARKQADLYKALEDPELFQRWQDVQLAQLMAAVSIGFAVFDAFAIGKAAKALTSEALTAIRVAEKAGARTAVRLVAQEARELVVRNMTEEVLERAIRQAVHEATVLVVMDQLLPKVLLPMLIPWMREQAQMHGTSDEVDAALGPLLTAGGGR